MMRTRLGSWTCPSGNRCDVFVWREAPGLEHLAFEWDTPPPLAPADELHYLGVILPAVTQCLAERAERPVGRTLYVRPRPSA
jgi:hypothetical protein